MAGLAVGSEVAGCRIDAVAGEGGMGIVYVATQLRLNRRVALKVIAPDLASQANFRERFKSESLLAASIEHPNVIPVYEAGETRRAAVPGHALRGGDRPARAARPRGQARARRAPRG